MENLPATSLTYQMFRCSIICTSLTPWIPRLALPSPSKQCWDEETLLEQGKCTGVHKLQHCLGERGKGGKLKANRVNCPKNFVLHCSLCDVGVRGGGGKGGGGTLRGEFELCGGIRVCLFYRA